MLERRVQRLRGELFQSSQPPKPQDFEIEERSTQSVAADRDQRGPKS
jgi:hypothetical protein